MATKYRLNREQFRVATRNDRGSVNYRKRYRRGDVVDVSKIDDDHLKNLIASRALVPFEDDLDEPVDPMDLPPTDGPFGGALVRRPDGTAPGAGTDDEDYDDEFLTEVALESNGEPDEEPDGSVAANTLDAPRDPAEEKSTEQPGEADSSLGEEGGIEVEAVDKYTEMDYATLQKEAKSANLNAGGTAEDLRQRLRENAS